MEPSSFSHSFPFVPPEVLCNFRETAFFARIAALWRAFRLYRFHR